MLVGLLVALTMFASLGLPAASAERSEVIGQSAEGREIRAVRVGDADAPVKMLVFGAIHGNERAGVAVSRRLRFARPPAGVELWLVDDLNPDGSAAGTRQK